MRYFGMAFAAVLLLGAVFFLGQGITGRVTSQTCCLPPSCPVEYLCSAAPQVAREEAATGDVRLGLLLAFAAVTVFITHELTTRQA